MEIIRDNSSVTEKRCAKCGETKPIGEFRKSKASRDGHMSYCRVCHSNDSKEKYEKNKELRLAQIDHWQQENIHKVTRYNDKWRKKQKKEARKLRSKLKNHPEKLTDDIIDKIEDGQTPDF